MKHVFPARKNKSEDTNTSLIREKSTNPRNTKNKLTDNHKYPAGGPVVQENYEIMTNIIGIKSTQFSQLIGSVLESYIIVATFERVKSSDTFKR